MMSSAQRRSNRPVLIRPEWITSCSTWKAAAGQIQTVVNNVVFPALDMILAIAFFGKLGMAYFDYRKHGQFEWAGPAILFACLVFVLLAPTYIWTIIGI